MENSDIPLSKFPLLDFFTFIGRFHPLLVHLPIGFLLLGIVLDVVAKRWGKAQQWKDAIRLTYLVGAASAVAAAFCGWLLAAGGAYSGDSLFWHRWLGTGVAIVATVLWIGKTGYLKPPKRLEQVLTLSLLGLITLTGHLGGNLTHGADYLLEYAPAFLRPAKDSMELALENASPDEVLIYQAVIAPILEEKCISCHNSDKQNGGLDMSSPDSLQLGGDGGEVLLVGNPMGSELFKRVTLDTRKKEFMPPKGTPLSYREIKLLEWWIANGASFEQHVAEAEVSDEIRMFLLEEYGLDTRSRPYTDKVQVAAISEEVLKQLEEVGFIIEPIAANNNFLSVRFAAKDQQLDAGVLEKLLLAKEQIAWLDIANCGVEDGILNAVGQLKNLVRLNLDRNPVTDAALQSLASLENLESLNLYATEITDTAIKSILELPNLQRVYLWQTQVSDAAVEQLQQLRPELEVVKGFAFAEVDAKK